MIVALFALCVAAALTNDCRLHRYDKYDIGTSSDLDYAVCASRPKKRTIATNECIPLIVV
jgi:hypothetical protein